MSRLPFETERKMVQKSRASTNEKFGKLPGQRSIEEHLQYGVINLDKPPGPTSHEVCAWIRKMLNLSKVGHGGTLDPKVTGTLPVTLEESTKIVQTLLAAGKEYVCLMRLHEVVPEKSMREVFKEFTGEILQRPPVKSAVKRQLRKRRIYYINLIEISDSRVLFRVGCEAGTYIRKLCHDIGEVLGAGAHMLELRRTKSGSLTEESSITLHDLMDAYAFWKENGDESLLRKAVLPVERAVEHLPKIIIRDSAVDAVCHGAELAVPGIASLDYDLKLNDMLAIFTLKGELVAIGEAKMDTKAILGSTSGIAVKVLRVLMKAGTYPRMWKKKEEEPRG